MKHIRSLLACGLFCIAFVFLAVPVLAEETVSQESAVVSQSGESVPAQDVSSGGALPESSLAPQTSVPAATSVPVVSSQAEPVQPSSVHSQEPRPAESAAASAAPAISEVQPSSAAVSAEESSSSEEAFSEENSSRASSWAVSDESGTVSADPMQGGTLSDGGGASRLYGLIAWIVIGAAALVSLIVLTFSKRTRGNKMSSGRAYARKRSVGYKRKRLLDDKYYQNLRRRR